jgi:STAS domain
LHVAERDAGVERGRASAPELQRKLLHVVNTTTGDVVPDCREVTFIDSAAIAMLLSVRRVLRVQRRGMRLVNLHGIAGTRPTRSGSPSRSRSPTSNRVRNAAAEVGVDVYP